MTYFEHPQDLVAFLHTTSDLVKSIDIKQCPNLNIVWFLKGVGMGRQIRIMTVLFLVYFTLVLMQSKTSVILHNGLDIAITMTKTSFSQNLKPFCILILQYIFFSFPNSYYPQISPAWAKNKAL